MSWPVAQLDAISRLRALAALTPGAIAAETILEAPFEVVWAVAADLEHELPRYLPDVRTFIITRRIGEQLEANAHGYVGLRAHFDIVLRPGWCVMRSRFLLGGMAAVPDGETTRFAFLGGVHIPAQGIAAPALSAVGQWTARRALTRFADRVQRRLPPPT